MLVERIIREDGTIECLFKSSNILQSDWNPKTGKLDIIFNYGGKYSYSNVSHKDYLRFEMDKSQGETFSKHIKTYKTDNLGKVDTTILKERLNIILNKPNINEQS